MGITRPRPDGGVKTGITRPRPDGGVKNHGKKMGITRPRPDGGVTIANDIIGGFIKIMPTQQRLRYCRLQGETAVTLPSLRASGKILHLIYPENIIDISILRL